ncbi:MAG: sulfatase [Planctomycetota bacterium]|nr:sulfatase [Planctomycetota bacterium]
MAWKNRRNLTGVSLCTALLAVGVASCGGDPSKTVDAPIVLGNGKSVILISIDSLRADFTTPYGHTPIFAPEEETTPFLAKLAKEGVLFEHTSAAAPWTLPSHVSMLSGMNPVEHGIRSRKYAIHEDIDLISNVFQNAGYQTGGFFTAPFLHPSWGFGRGFDVYIPSADYLGTIEAGAALAAHGKSELVEEIHASSHTDNRTGEQAIDHAVQWLEHDKTYEEPFFLFVHLWDPHYDYFPPEEYRKQFLPNDDGSVKGDELMLPDREPSAQELEVLKALYEAEIRYTDDQIKRLYEQLEAWGLADDVVFAVVSDHGDEFMEHGNRGHHLTLKEEVMNVPMIIHAPGLIDGNQRVQASVSITDISPTLIDLAELPAWTDRTGQSLRPLWEDEDTDREVAMDLLRPTKKIQLLGYRYGMKKGILNVPQRRVRVFDLEMDPGELNSPEPFLMNSDNPFVVATINFHTRMLEFSHDVENVSEPPAMKESLNALGYTDDVSNDDEDDEK